MTPPPALATWQTQMASSAEPAQILQNLLSESCLQSTIEDEFFNRIAGAPAAASAQEAWDVAKTAVWHAPQLNYKRAAVPVGRFDNLIRFTLPTKLPAIVSGLDVAALGLSAGDLDRATPAELEMVLDEARLSTSITLSYLVWVAEVSPDLEASLPTPNALMDRLGLPIHLAQINNGGCCVELRYQRTNLPLGVELHVPSSLDGIDNPAFRPVSDCAAPCGSTAALSAGGAAGFPEAIHRGCVVTPFEIKVLPP